MAVKDTIFPVFRGMNYSDDFKLHEYNPGQVGFWPSLTSTSSTLKAAREFCKRRSKNENKSIIFEIFLTRNNSPITHLELNSSWSFHYETEKEVLLLPFFFFQTVKVEVIN